MNKTELIDEIAEQADVSKAMAARVLDAAISAVTTALRNGEPVTLLGFGTFYVNSRAEHSGRNPRTGEPITIAAANVPKFKAGKSLKEAIN
ncbi:MAG: HU family DNA-binding protein [Azoarcus sp.]|jgi:DNA-binding protein HU-beta|nr:HU family DNA-binding protein [Azoarcus sp.]